MLDTKKALHQIKAWGMKNTALSVVIISAFIVLIGFVSYRFDPLYVIGGLAAFLLFVIILHNPWNGLWMLAFFIPFERIGSVDIAGMTVRPSQVTALLMMASLFLHYGARQRKEVPSNPTVLPLIAYVIVGLIGLLNAPNIERSTLVLAFTIFTIVISIVVPFLLQKKADVHQLFRYFFASLLIVTLFGLFQFVGDLAGLPTTITGLRELYTKDILGFPRVQSTALEPLYFANYLLVPLSVLLSLFLARDKTWNPAVILGLFGLGAVNLVLTVARGGYIAFAFSALIVLAFYFFQLKLWSWRNFFTALGGVVLSALIVVRLIGFDVISENFLGHVSNLFGGASFNERVEMYDIATDAWMDHPVIGIGPGSFGPYASAHPYVVPNHGWNIVNNLYLELLAESGIVGLALMTIVFLIVLIRSVKALMVAKDPFLRTILLGVFAAFTGILIQYNTFSIIYIVHVWFTIGILIALQNMIFKEKKRG